MAAEEELTMIEAIYAKYKEFEDVHNSLCKIHVSRKAPGKTGLC